MATVDHRGNLGLRKIGSPAGFLWHSWECMNDPDDTVKLTGCVSSGLHAKGPRKGRPKYDGKPVIALVTHAEFLAEQARFEREEGKCRECGGDGRQFARWDHKEGTTWKPCSVCGATGKPKSDPARFTPSEEGKADGSADPISSSSCEGGKA